MPASDRDGRLEAAKCQLTDVSNLVLSLLDIFQAANLTVSKPKPPGCLKGQRKACLGAPDVGARKLQGACLA